MLKKQKIFSILVVFVLNTSLAFASSSASFQTNEENINFAANEGYLESTSYELDLSDVSWTERYAESPSYTLIDVNSDLDLGSPKPPPTPPPTPSGGGSSGTGPGGGVPLVYADVPLVSENPVIEERELNVLDEEVQNPAEEPVQILKPSPEEVEEMIEDEFRLYLPNEQSIIEKGLDSIESESSSDYNKVEYKVINEIVYVKPVLTEVKKPCIRFDLLAIYIIIILTAIYSLWKQRA